MRTVLRNVVNSVERRGCIWLCSDIHFNSVGFFIYTEMCRSQILNPCISPASLYHHHHHHHTQIYFFFPLYVLHRTCFWPLGCLPSTLMNKWTEPNRPSQWKHYSFQSDVTFAWTDCVLYKRCYLSCADPSGRLLAGRVRIPLGTWSIVCCQVEVSGPNRSPIQRSSTDCGVSLCVI